jgi:hypothetical protein
MRGCVAARYPVAMDAGWHGWDFDIAAGPAGDARILVAGENHGADKRLLRVRSMLRLSPCARIAIGGFGALTVLSLIGGWGPAATIFGVLTTGCAGIVAWQFARFVRRLHPLVEAAARECALIPVKPRAGEAAINQPRTA